MPRTDEELAVQFADAGVEWQKYAALMVPYQTGTQPREGVEYEMVRTRFDQLNGAMLALYWMNGQRDKPN